MIAELALIAALTDEPVIDETPYVLVVWESTGAYPDLWPQQLVTYMDQTVPDMYALDAQFPTCGVVQVDLYHDGDMTRNLIAGGVLYGPGNPPEALAYVVDGEPWRVVDLGECVPPVDPPVDPPIDPPVEPPTVIEPPTTTGASSLAETGGPDWGVALILGPVLIGIGLLGRRYWGNPERKP